MPTRKLTLAKLTITAVLLGAHSGSAQGSGAGVPPSWSQKDVSTFRLPLAGLGAPPSLISEREYYALPEVNLRTYPVYVPEREPPNYLKWVEQQDPQPMVNVSKLKTDQDWADAGREVFYGRELPRFTGNEDNLQLIRDPQALAAYRLQTTKDGVILGLRYVVRQKGKVELGTNTCAMCHVQVRPDGELIEGAPNVHTPFGPIMADLTRRYTQMGPETLRDRRLRMMREDYRVPFLKDDPNLGIPDLPAEQIAQLYEQYPLGSQPRTNTSLLYPVRIANLIGMQDLHYFDRTGTSRNRNIRDLMRYCALIADSSEALIRYGSGPDASLDLNDLGLSNGIHRTPDALLYALAKFIYSLKPPPNPNPVDDRARQGEEVFRKGKCEDCHTPPLYTDNKLTLAEGFKPSGTLAKEAELRKVSLGTDPGLALKTRTRTGLYRVPSLRMLWLQACFLHDCSVGSLEELFNQARMYAGFRSSNWSPATPAHAVKGHRHGMNLSPDDKAALIAFLRTL